MTSSQANNDPRNRPSRYLERAGPGQRYAISRVPQVASGRHERLRRDEVEEFSDSYTEAESETGGEEEPEPAYLQRTQRYNEQPAGKKCTCGSSCPCVLHPAPSRNVMRNEPMGNAETRSAQSSSAPMVVTTIAPHGACRTAWGDSVTNYNNFILFTNGLTYRTMLQWVFKTQDLINKKEDEIGTVFTKIPEKTVAMGFHGVTIESKHPHAISQHSEANKGVFGGREGEYAGPSVIIATASASSIESIPTRNGGIITSEKYEITNSLTSAERELLCNGRNNHQVQILQVSLYGYSNPYPFAIGIVWNENTATHMSHAGDQSYMFIMQALTTTVLSRPEINNIRNKLDVTDSKIGSRFERDRKEGMYLRNPNNPGADIFVYMDTILYNIIIHYNPTKKFEESYMGGRKGASVPPSIVQAGLHNLEACSSVKFVGYDAFTFSLVPVMPETAFMNMNGSGNQHGFSKTVLLKTFLEEFDIKMSALKLVSASISFNYL